MAASLGRRQSGRAIRSTASKQQNYYGRGPPPEAPLPADTEPGFFPAITHFTDAVDALPREVMRHFTMLKEMEAKLHGPDEMLVELAKRIERLPGRKPNEDDAHPANGVSEVNGADVIDPVAPRSEGERGTLLRQLRDCVALMAPMLDEKIAVLSTANITLERQLECMKSSYDRVPDEVSVEARLGSTTHWAYVVEKEPKKTGNERSRRDVANTYSVSGLNDVAAAQRSEARREAMLARKIRNQHLDSDFDERPASRKQSSKSRKQAEAQSADARGFGHDLQNGSGGRKQKKPAAQAMEKTMSNAGSRHKGQTGSPTPVAENSKKRKAGSVLMPGRKRLQQTAGGRSPNQFSTPILGTFTVKESSTARTSHARGRHGSSSSAIQPLPITRITAPAPNNTNGPTLNLDQFPPKSKMPEIPTMAETRPAPSPELRVTNAASIEATMAPLKQEPGEPTGGEEIKGAAVQKADIETVPAASTLPAVSSTSRRGSKVASPLVAAAVEPRDRGGVPPTVAASTATHPVAAPPTPTTSLHPAPATAPSRSNRLRDAGGAASNGGSHASSESGAGSGTAVTAAPPAAPAAPVPERASTREKRRRESRDVGQAAVAEARKGSTAGLAAGQASAAPPATPTQPLPRERQPHQDHPKRPDRAAAKADDEDDEEAANVDEDGEEEGDEPRYCYCNEVSYGEMVACDNENCARQWFHLRCVGLREAPTTAKWYCDECKMTMKESRRSRPNSRRE